MFFSGLDWVHGCWGATIEVKCPPHPSHVGMCDMADPRDTDLGHLAEMPPGLSHRKVTLPASALDSGTSSLCTSQLEGLTLQHLEG